MLNLQKQGADKKKVAMLHASYGKTKKMTKMDNRATYWKGFVTVAELQDVGDFTR